MTETKRCGTCKEVKPLGMFHRMKSNILDGRSYRCKPCDSEARKLWTHRNPERQLTSQRNRKLKHDYGINLEIYQQMLDKQNRVCAICFASENNAGRESTRLNGFVVTPLFSVDHCHATGKIRGLLCNQCNRAIGMLGDDPVRVERALSYLKYELEHQADTH